MGRPHSLLIARPRSPHSARNGDVHATPSASVLVGPGPTRPLSWPLVKSGGRGYLQHGGGIVAGHARKQCGNGATRAGSRRAPRVAVQRASAHTTMTATTVADPTRRSETTAADPHRVTPNQTEHRAATTAGTRDAQSNHNDSATGDWAMTLFDEGFCRGVAFTRWLASRPDLAMPQLAV